MKTKAYIFGVLL